MNSFLRKCIKHIKQICFLNFKNIQEKTFSLSNVSNKLLKLGIFCTNLKKKFLVLKLLTNFNTNNVKIWENFTKKWRNTVLPLNSYNLRFTFENGEIQRFSITIRVEIEYHLYRWQNLVIENFMKCVKGENLSFHFPCTEKYCYNLGNTEYNFNETD